MGWLLIILVALMVALFVYGRYWHVRAAEPALVTANVSRAQAMAIVSGTFGRTWARESGAGTVNMKPMLRRNAPTLSVDIVETGPETCEVKIWVSAYPPMFGMMNHGQVMARKKNALASALAGVRPAVAG